MKRLKISLLNDLRKYLTDPASRGTSITETFNGDDLETEFSLTNTSLMYIDSITINSVSKKLNRDYYLDFGRGATTGKITFITAPTTGTNNISITYKYGDNWIYPGTPQTSNRQLPRIGILRTGGGHRPAGTAQQSEFVDANFRLGIWVKSGESYTISDEIYTGDKLLDYIEDDISTQIVKMRRDYDEPYKVITWDIQSTVDIPFDEQFKLNRREISIRIMYQKSYS